MILNKYFIISILFMSILFISGCGTTVYTDYSNRSSVVNNINQTNNITIINNVTTNVTTITNITNNITLNDSRGVINYTFFEVGSTITSTLYLVNGTCYSQSVTDSIGAGGDPDGNNVTTGTTFTNVSTNLTLTTTRLGMVDLVTSINISQMLQSVFNTFKTITSSDADNNTQASQLATKYNISNEKNYINDTYGNATYYLLTNPNAYVSHNNYTTGTTFTNVSTNLTLTTTRLGMVDLVTSINISQMLQSVFNTFKTITSSDADNTTQAKQLDTKYNLTNEKQYINDTYGNATYYLKTNPVQYINDTYGNATYVRTIGAQANQSLNTSSSPMFHNLTINAFVKINANLTLALCNSTTIGIISMNYTGTESLHWLCTSNSTGSYNNILIARGG